MILLVIIILICLYLIQNNNEHFSQEIEDENYYNYCYQNFTLRNCVPDDKCLNFGFKNICS